VDSSDDSTQKIGLETNSGGVFPALARTACAEPPRPFKRNLSALPQKPFSPQTGLPSSPSRDESHRLSSLSYPPLASRLSPARCLCLISLQRDASVHRRTRGINRLGRASAGDPIGRGCPLGLRLCLIRMLGHPKILAAHPDQACNQPDIDTSRQTPGLAEALVQARDCAS
jgi:hypothetical protein